MPEDNVDTTEFCYQDLNAKISYFSILAEHYRMDVQAVWARATVFMTINGALFALYGSDYLSKEPQARAVISVFSLLLCAVWTLSQCVTTMWLRDWRYALCELDKDIVFKGGFGRVFYNTEPHSHLVQNGQVPKKFHHRVRPQHLGIALAALVFLLWAVCLSRLINIKITVVS